MTPEERLRASLVDLAAEVRPGEDVLAGVERHIRGERRRRVAVQAAVVALSVVLLVAVGLTVPLLRQHDDPGPAATTTTTVRRAEPSSLDRIDAQVFLAERVGAARLATLQDRLEAIAGVERVAYESPAAAKARWEAEHGRPAATDVNFNASILVQLRDPARYEAFSREVCSGGGSSMACLRGALFVQPVLPDAEARARGDADRKARAAALAEWGERVRRLTVGEPVPKAWLTSAVLEVATRGPSGPVTVAAVGRTPDRRRLVLLAYPSAGPDSPDLTCLVVLGSRARERFYIGCSRTWGVDEGKILVDGIGDGKRLIVGGPVPAGTRTVRIERPDGPPITVGATTAPGYDWAFFLTELPANHAPSDIVALSAGGRVLARQPRR
jgi:hypothetical protein